MSEKGLSKIHKLRMINFPVVTRQKIIDQLDVLIKAMPDDFIVHIETMMILQTILIIIWTMWRKFLGMFLKTPVIETNPCLKYYYSKKGIGYIKNNGIIDVHLGRRVST